MKIFPDFILLARKGDEKKSIKIELWPAVYYDRHAGSDQYRLMMDGKWHPDDELKFFTWHEAMGVIGKELGGRGEDDISALIEMPIGQDKSGLGIPNFDKNKEPVDLNEKYARDMAAVDRVRYSPDVIDRYFATKYGTNIYSKQTERQYFDQLSASEKRLYMTKAMAMISESTLEIVFEYYRKLKPNDLIWVKAQVDHFKSRPLEEQEMILNGIQKKPNPGNRDGNTNGLSEIELAEAEKLNGMSPEEQRMWIKQKRKEDRARTSAGKQASINEKDIDEDLSDMPDEWMK